VRRVSQPSHDNGRERDTPSATGERGQINFDFAIGVSILAIAVLFALTIAPAVVGTEEIDRTGSNAVAAERVASWLTGDALGDGETTPHCLAALLDEPAPTAGCGFSGSTLAERVPVENRAINVTVEHTGTRQCWSGLDEGIVAQSTSCTEWLAAGPSAQDGDAGATARRSLTVGGRTVIVTVRVW